MTSKSKARLSDSKISKNIFFSQLIFSLIFAVASFLVPNNYSLVLPVMIFGTLFLYFLSPTIAFVYSFIFVIDPMATFELSAISIVPILLCFTFFFLNIKKCLTIINKDKYLLKIMQLCLIFTIYQVIVSLLLLSQQDFYFVFKNVRYWLGIWLLIPAYVFVVLDKKTLFISITLVALIVMVFYYMTFFGIYSFFEIQEVRRANDDENIIRFFSFDLRQITKIFVYILPLVIIFPFKKPAVKILVVAIGFMVYASVILAILRTEMFYLFMGALLAVAISIRQFKTIGTSKILIMMSAGVALILYLFPSLLDTIVQTVELTSRAGGGMSSDESADHRLYVQLPVLMKIVESSPFFGGGLYAVSYEATTHYLLYDIPILGAFGAYGIVGMLLYYSRFVIIFSRYKAAKMSQYLFNLFPVECVLVNGLLAYFITMITFRTLHINIELAFDSGMAELGLFIGVYFALIRFLAEQKAIV
jgi:hypothetical protein